MTPELSDIKDWAARARAADYQVDVLAAACGVSPWCMNHFFLTRTGLHAHEWLAELRQMDGFFMLSEGRTKKDVAVALNYSDPAHFGRAFKRVYGITPGEALRQHLDMNEVLARKPLLLFSLDQAINQTAENGQTNVLNNNSIL